MILAYITRAGQASRYPHINFACDERKPLDPREIDFEFRILSGGNWPGAVDPAFSLR